MEGGGEIKSLLELEPARVLGRPHCLDLVLWKPAAFETLGATWQGRGSWKMLVALLLLQGASQVVAGGSSKCPGKEGHLHPLA